MFYLPNGITHNIYACMWFMAVCIAPAGCVEGLRSAEKTGPCSSCRSDHRKRWGLWRGGHGQIHFWWGMSRCVVLLPLRWSRQTDSLDHCADSPLTSARSREAGGCQQWLGIEKEQSMSGKEGKENVVSFSYVTCYFLPICITFTQLNIGLTYELH